MVVRSCTYAETQVAGESKSFFHLLVMALIHGLMGSSIIDPFESLSLFDRACPSFPRDSVGTVANDGIDWVESPQAHVLKADLPGMKKEEIKVQISDNGILTISGERALNEKGSHPRVERAYGTFHRQLKLPSDAKVQEVTAQVENGVLTVTVPKTELSDETP
ncbi:HSP20 family protein [Marchantia polymorpha subsp. ruderalis]|uniref:SHSP domain-containing protein n=2 Tax=Marchantia polymorpha TaxID=3197 RepID=A0AAF6BV94_MARPO|nr:hypothetical protein MARPO_0088s0083 [Marchantia polymorpha]BBN15928.1 hypothetical protein Mp_7g02030 [Marchantia polymorpha subsp. ruderalis]|eukprot:PTQ33543.1 hypothetical protein MARPO_0088s0083 [Marchantia polymorpha]